MTSPGKRWVEEEDSDITRLTLAANGDQPINPATVGPDDPQHRLSGSFENLDGPTRRKPSSNRRLDDTHNRSVFWRVPHTVEHRAHRNILQGNMRGSTTAASKNRGGFESFDYLTASSESNQAKTSTRASGTTIRCSQSG
jgi:hypothetical protein